MSIWNRVQYPEHKQTLRAFINTMAVVVVCGIPALIISSTVSLVVGLSVG